MTIDDDKLDELERCAEAATEGPWWREFEGVYTDPGDDNEFTLVATAERDEMFPELGSRPADIDAMYIAAADPPTVLELVQEIRKLRADRDRYREALKDINDKSTALLGGIQLLGGIHHQKIAEEALGADDE